MKMISSLIILLVLDFRSHALPTGCKSNEWQCADGTCISLSERCDNFPDCTDGSDELKCTVSPVCLEGLESCPQPNGTTVCVKKAVGCNCGPVKDIANGEIKSVNITIGSVATVVCDTGYDATLPTVTCQVTGLWETVSCIPKECRSTPSISFGNITLSDDKNSTFGATAEVTCDNGYLENKHFIICQSSGVWENAACLPIDCGPVQSTAFGSIVLVGSNNTTFGTSALVTCDAGYEANTTKVLCLKSGLWEGAECTIRGCGIVPAISNGIIKAPANDSVGSFASVVCDKGYEANVSSVFCKISGQWESASCTLKDCGQTPAISYGQITANDITTYGSSANVTCYTGYTSNVSKVYCQSTGVWEESACYPIDCGPVQSIAFGTIVLADSNNTTFGASALVTCDAGYEASTTKVLCLKSGLWEGAECTIQGCGIVPAISNGIIKAPANDSVGSFASVVCDKGYEANVSTVFCKISGQWESASCTIKDCGQTPAIPYGQITANDITTYGSSANVTCYTGYTSNVSKVYCQSTGLWEESACYPIDCGPVQSIAFGTIILGDINNTTFGAFADVTCDAGYKTNTSRVLCLKSGLWETAECTIRDCGQTPAIPYGQITANDITTYGSSANVTCYTGYTSNVSKVYCQSTGVWEESSCKPIDCGPSPFIKYGSTSLGNDNKTTFGATVFVSCQDKYVATSSSIKCQASGLWENATCVFKGCGPLPKISHGTIKAPANVSVGSFASVACDTGYEANVSSIMCRSSGHWETAVCTVKDCGQPPVIPYGQSSPVDYKNVTYGASASVICLKGYESNVSTILCQSTGVWQTAVCRPKDCGSPPAIAFGNTSLNSDRNTKFGALANITCDHNFATGTPVIICQSTGKWENAICSNKGCQSLPVINNGAVTAVGNTTVGAYATVTCDNGYEPSTPKVMCKMSGTWETASCIPKDCGPTPLIANGNITLVFSNKSTYQEEAFVTCHSNYSANVSRITCQSTGFWEAASCISESKLNYDMCTKEHGTCTQHVYENVRLRGLKSSKCKTFCHCAYASTLPTGNVTYKWVEHSCPSGTLFDDSLPSPVCNHAFFVVC